MRREESLANGSGDNPHIRSPTTFTPVHSLLQDVVSGLSGDLRTVNLPVTTLVISGSQPVDTSIEVQYNNTTSRFGKHTSRTSMSY